MDSESSDLGSDEEWIPGGDVEGAYTDGKPAEAQAESKLAVLFGGLSKKPSVNKETSSSPVGTKGQEPHTTETEPGKEEPETGPTVASIEDENVASVHAMANAFEPTEAAKSSNLSSIEETGQYFQAQEAPKPKKSVHAILSAFESGTFTTLRSDATEDGGNTNAFMAGGQAQPDEIELPDREEQISDSEDKELVPDSALSFDPAGEEFSNGVEEFPNTLKYEDAEEEAKSRVENLRSFQFENVEEGEGTPVATQPNEYSDALGVTSSAISSEEAPTSPPPAQSHIAVFRNRTTSRGDTRSSLTELSATLDRTSVVAEGVRPSTADTYSSSMGAIPSMTSESENSPSVVRGGVSQDDQRGSAGGRLDHGVRPGHRDAPRSGLSFNATPATSATPTTPEAGPATMAVVDSSVVQSISESSQIQISRSRDEGGATVPEPLQPPIVGDRARSDSIRGADGITTLPGIVNRGKMSSARSHKDLPTVKYRSGSLRSDNSVDSDGKSSNLSFGGYVGQRTDSENSADFSEKSEDHYVDDVDHDERLSSEGSLPPASDATSLLQVGNRAAPHASGLGAQDMSLCSTVPDKSVLECIVDLLKGTRAQKQKAKQKALKRYGQRWIWLGDDLTSIVWKSKKQEFGTIALTEVCRLRSEKRELIVEHISKRTVVLMLSSVEETQVWLTGLSCLVPKKCKVKMDGEILKERLSYDPHYDTWRGRVLANQKTVQDYILLGEIDRGFLALSTADKRFFNVKVVKNMSHPPNAERIAMLKKMAHRHVVKHKEVLWDEKLSVGIFVDEYMARGVVFECRAGVEPKPLLEDALLEIMRDVVRGLDYLHSHKFAHNALRPDSFYRSGDGSVKIEGLSVTEEGDALSPLFRAPEVEAGLSSNRMAADVWSIGACMFFMLTGKAPFDSLKAKNTGKLKIGREHKFSRKLKDVFEKVFVREPSKRPTIGELLKHHWFQPKIVQKPTEHIEISNTDIHNAYRKINW